MNFDVVIIGSGPAGIAAAMELSKTGASVALIDKYFFPRDKTCAGILTQKTVSFIQQTFPSLCIEQFPTTTQISLMYDCNEKSVFSVQKSFVFVNRRMFDSMLLNICQNQTTNIKVMLNIQIENIDPNKNILYLNNDTSIKYRCLIVSDGIHSHIRKKLGVPDIPKGFCIQDYVERSMCNGYLSDLQSLVLNYGNLPFGYSWIIPQGEQIIIGTGVMSTDFNWSSMLNAHKKLCKKIGMPESSKQRGAHIPIGILTNQLAHPYENIVFVGDAAGLINPLTGEGIYLALLSGTLAGKAYSLNQLQFKKSFLSLLEPTINTISEQVKLATHFYNNSLLKNFINQFKDYPEYFAYACDDVISLEKKSYQSLFLEIQGLLR